jgi:glycosyltransferase involved in cell wall biosynthesis
MVGATDAPFLLLVSRLERVKHPEDVLDVLAAVRRTHPDVTALLIGGGSLTDELREHATRLGVADAVVFAGERDQEFVASAVADAAVILSPLTGRALVEASLGGRPIVAYDVEWHAEYLGTGAGVLVPYRDTDAMAAAVVALLDDAPAADALGARGRAHALATMNPAELREHERRAFDGVLASHMEPAR